MTEEQKEIPIIEGFDVAIVGGGPAGLWCAKNLAEKGVKAIIFDKKQELGVPVRCGEGLGLGWFKKLGVEPKPEFCARAMNGAVLFTKSGKEVKIDFGKVSGYVIERRMFEKYLGYEAAKLGAQIKMKTKVLSLEKDSNGKINGVKVHELGQTKIYKAKVVVAADGFESMIARQAGFKSYNTLYHVDSGFQYEMAGIDIPHPDLIHLYFGTEIAPRGYIWIFPKGEDRANVGIGILGSIDKTAKQYLDEWIETQPGVKKGAIINVNYGGIPVGGFLDKMTDDNFMIIGDAAHQVNPIHGGGIGLAMEAGALAAKAIIKAKELNNYSNEVLEEYTKEWYAPGGTGEHLKQILVRRKMFEQITDEDMEQLAEAFKGEDIMKLIYGSGLQTAALVTAKLIKYPKLATLLVKYLKMKPE